MAESEAAESAPNRRVLAISSDLDQLRRMVGNLERAGAEVDASSSLTSLSEADKAHRYIFCAVAEGEVEPVNELVKVVHPQAHVAVVVPKARLEHLNDFLRDDRVNHVIVGEEINRGTFITAQKLLTGDIFGIEKYLPPDTPVHYLRLRDFDGRGKAIDAILDFAAESKVRRQVRTAIGSVCEELLMNALYDAPVDGEGQQIFAEVDPHDRVKTRSPKPVSIRYAATDSQFVIAVRDRFGRLAKNTVLAYIDKCLHSPTQIDRKTYGAGLGLYLVANAAASFIVNVAYGIATEVICTFDRGAKAPLRLVGVFVHPAQAEKLREGPTPETAQGQPSRLDTVQDAGLPDG